MALPRKRKIDDFFELDHTRVRHHQAASHIFDSPLTVPGLRIIHDFVSAEEETQILKFLDTQHWRTDLTRRVIHYGGTYCLLPPRNATAQERQRIEKEIFTAEPMPDEFSFLTARLIGHKLYTTNSAPRYCIVNEYKERQGISAHVENFRFQSPVCGLTLVNGDWMRFHELVKSNDGSVRSGKAATAPRTGKIEDVWMPRRSLLVMDGEARNKWQHEILRSRKGRHGMGWRRVSLTFRSDTTPRPSQQEEDTKHPQCQQLER